MQIIRQINETRNLLLKNLEREKKTLTPVPAPGAGWLQQEVRDSSTLTLHSLELIVLARTAVAE